ncbi:uncharacterized protein BKA55DRAFT_668838 [Fusarium redolens]|uniref:Uncharacterized protein n=1 Tax=Fusarium redolens TaxID=48865 RepID=A0A9P9FYF6_FUSRE|nr:uncharacterized protein BKA55DRAFT_668838 [Fusarium redolens]KAH7205483.1 hypothetical protein BKA55DRAFT_668838 [Fusarium redolens]
MDMAILEFRHKERGFIHQAPRSIQHLLGPLQDAEAFYHDISEISYEAQSTVEFHHVASNSRQQRLCELNNSLESAIQVFRTNSLDSLVRYFASYLPADHIWHPLCQDSALVATDAVSTPPLPKKRCKRIKMNEATDSGRQTLLSPSMVLGRLPAKDQSLEPNEPLDSAPPAVFSYVGHGSFGDGMSTMSDSDAFTMVECRIKNTLNETVRPYGGSSTKLSLKQIDLASNHSGGQRGRCVDCQVSAHPKTLTSLPVDLSFSGPLRTPVASDGSVQVAAGAMVGLKRKRC